MTALDTHQTAHFFLAVAALIGTARVFGETAQRLHQPSVLGEIVAGIVLGPTILGRLLPDLTANLFPRSGPQGAALHGLTSVSLILFLLAAGLEVEIAAMLRQGKAAAVVSVFGLVVPFGIGFASVELFPGLRAHSPEGGVHLFALLVATALAISALPVIAKTLIDLRLLRTDIGALIIAAAISDDLVGWIIFATVLAMIGPSQGAAIDLGSTVLLTLLFTAFMLTVGRWLFQRLVLIVQAKASWPGGIIGLGCTVALVAAAFTERIGIHGMFGSFLAGVAMGDAPHMRERSREIVSNVIAFTFAPLFFASIGLKIDIAAHFDVPLILFVLLIASLGKIAGCGVGARICGISARESAAIGFAMNARGAMGIILGDIAFQANLIDQEFFVAFVIMAIVTSAISGGAMARLLELKRPTRFTDFLSSKLFIPNLRATTRREAIRELSDLVASVRSLDADVLFAKIWNRDELLPHTGTNRFTVPHARIPGLPSPLVAIGLSRQGIRTAGSDAEPTDAVVLVLTPQSDPAIHVRLLSDVAETFAAPAIRKTLRDVGSFTQLLALLRSEH